MPYKLSEDKKSVLIFKDGKWSVLKKYRNPKKALAYFRALKINVRH